ncbi:MAG: ABC-three component system middle component 6 [Bacteroidales bacterium]
MIAPDKHTNIKYSIIYISGIVLKTVQENGIIKYDELLNTIIKQTGNQSKDVFQYALSFLFLNNKIEYNQKLDSITITE